MGATLGPAQREADVSDTDARLLTGEEVIYGTAKHWFAPAADSKWAVLMIIAAVLLAWIQPDASDGILGFFGRIIELARLGLFFGGLGWIAYNIVAWRTAEYTVTNRRVLCREGLVRSRSTDTLLTSITDLRTRIPALGRMLGFGDITIMSASGEAGTDRFSSIRDVEGFKRQILELKTQAPAGETGERPPAAGVPPEAASALAAADLTATLGELAKLRDAGAITPAEFEGKKAELLARI